MGLKLSAMSQSYLNEKVINWAEKIHLITIIDRVIENKESVVNLNNCNISMLPGEFFMINQPMEINLSHNQITDLPPEWSTLHIRSLALDYNKLTTIPSVLKKCKCLTWLNLGHNPLKSISSDIGDIDNLDTLWINCTEIDYLPKEIGKLTSLETFGARRNYLKTFPSELCYLENLSWLTLANNKIQELPEEFYNLKNLVHLNLSHNYLKEVPLVLTELQNLEYCYLSYNLIRHVTEEVLLKMSHVKCLNLKGNKLLDVNVDDLKMKFAVIDGCEMENLQNQDTDSDSEDWENSVASSELYFEMSDDESDEQGNNMEMDRASQVLAKVAKFT
ncbi:uncharacterized protein LOC142319015 isoform X2 [Lycorma delicatula]|uniref:uncharacterized protein LOC142319015 isoform X2 n=1 Tax=Lycorma delicatula TaxID=130591 RepID=UPI003F513225